MSKEIKIQKTKGRPMLHWVGKKPLNIVKGFPTQLIEFFNPTKEGKVNETPSFKNLKNNWHNLLFEGDNKEVLATLIEQGYRNKIDLIYIDPPYASNKDYVRKVKLKGVASNKIEEDDAPILQQVMYEDIWKKDEYFQWMYERLILMKELLSDKGLIYLHIDYRMSHYLKLIMDEIFGEENFRNEIIWCYSSPQKENGDFKKKHQTILRYSKTPKYISNLSDVRIPYKKLNTGTSKAIFKKDYTLNEKGKIPEDWWIIEPVGRKKDEIYGFATQKPEALLERIIKASSNPDSIVMDCFNGSGTTVAVAQKLGRKWIGVDINKGAIQLAGKRVSMIINSQIKDELFKNEIYSSFAYYRVNDYDLKLMQSEAKELAIKYLGITRIRTDNYFEGKLGNKLVKIIDFNHPLSIADLEALKEELKKRDYTGDIVIVSYGQDINTNAWIDEWNRKMSINKLEIKNLKTDKNTGGFLIYSPPQADVEISIKDKKAKIKINDFISPSVIKRFNLEKTLLDKKLTDFRSQIEYIAIDTDYNGKYFNSVFTDIPQKKEELIKGEYNIDLPEKNKILAIKIVDVLGGEILIEKEI